MKIEKNMLFSLVNDYMNENNNENKDFLSGVQGTLSMLNKYFKIDKSFQCSRKFKFFALENFLSGDEKKLETFEKLMQLYIIKINQLAPVANWEDYPKGSNRNFSPKQLNLSIFNTLKQCFSGIDLIVAIEGYDSEDDNIFLNVYYKKPNGIKSYIEVNQNGDFEEEGKKNIVKNSYCCLIELEKHLEQSIHYELLLLYICLKNFYNYISHDNINKLLKKELDK